MKKNRPQTPGRAPETKLTANAPTPDVSRVPATFENVPLLATKFDIPKSPSSHLIESLPYEDSSAGSSLNLKSVSSPAPSSSSRNPQRLLYSGTSKMPTFAPSNKIKTSPLKFKIITALMLLTAVIAQPYYLGKPNGAFYLPSALSPAAIPASCIEWAYPNNSTCYCANTNLTNPTMMIDPSLIGPSFYLKTLAGQWGSLINPGPFQTQLSMTFEDMFNPSNQVSSSVGTTSSNQQSLSFKPQQLVNKISIYNEFLSADPNLQSHKRWDIAGFQIINGTQQIGVIDLQTARCSYYPKGPIVGVQTYLSSANYFCGVALAYNTCSCTQSLFLLFDYELRTLNWVTGMPSVDLSWRINISINTQYMTNFLPQNCGNYLLSPVTTNINGYIPVSIVSDSFLVSTPGSPNSVTLTNPTVTGVYQTLLQLTNPSGYLIPGDSTIYYATPLYFFVKVVITLNKCVIGLKSGQIDQIIEAPADPSVSFYIIVPPPDTCDPSPQYIVQATQLKPTVGTLQTNPPFWVLDLVNNRVILQSNDPTLHDTTWKLDLVVTVNSVANTQELIVAWYICNLLVFNSKPIWKNPYWSPSSLVASILGPPVSSMHTKFSTYTGVCGLVTYSISPALPSYITYNQVYRTITVAAPFATTMGSTTFTLKATSNDWPAMTVDVPITVTITACVVLSITTTPLISGVITKKILVAATTYPISTYVQTPACQYSPQYAVQATQLLPTVGTPQTNPPFWVLDAANAQVKLQSFDTTLHGTTWKLDLVVTIGSITNTQTFDVTWVDPCRGTTFAAQTIADSFGFISDPAIAVSVPVPWLNDQANIANGGSTTSSICSTQSFLVTENGLSPSYLSTSFDSGRNFIKFATTNTLMAGPHVIKVDYKLDLYPAVNNTAFFNFVFYDLLVPIPPATTTYQVASAALSILVGEYKTNPFNPAMVITKTATLASGVALPGFIVFSEIATQFTVSSIKNSDVGTYQILLTSTFTLVDQTRTKTQTFTLKVIPQTVGTNFVTQVDVEQALDTVGPIASNKTKTLLELAKGQYSASASSTTWDWMSQYLAALARDQKDKTIGEPDVYISSISYLGVVNFSFTKAMLAPPLEMIQNARVETLENPNLEVKQFERALQISVKPGLESLVSNLGFTYNITSYTSRNMQVQLNFTNTLQVSAIRKFHDLLEARFVGNFYFFDTYGGVLPENKVVTYKLPAQMQFGTKATQALVAIADVVFRTSNGVITSSFALNIFLSASLQQLWSMVQMQQIVVLMPLWQIRLPANAALFFGYIMTIASFDLLPTDTFYDKYFPDMAPTTAINANFETIGFKSMYFNYNIGSLIIYFLAFPALAFVALILKPLRMLKWCDWLYLQITGRIFWNTTLQTISQSYTVIVMCVCINTLNVSNQTKPFQLTFESHGEILSSSLTIFFGLVVTVFPVFLVTYLYKKFDQLDTPEIKSKVGQMYSEFYIQRGRSILMTLMIFYLRRVLIPLSVVYNNFLIIQIYAMVATIFAQIVNVAYVRPFSGGASASRMEMFNEIVLVFIMYTMICFTDFVPDLETQFGVGYIVCILVVGHLLINLAIMLYTSFRLLTLKFKGWIIRRKYKVEIGKHQLARIAVAAVKEETEIEIGLIHEMMRQGNKREKLSSLTQDPPPSSQVIKEISHPKPVEPSKLNEKSNYKALQVKKIELVESFSFRDICINDSDLIDVNKSYPLGQLEKHFEKVRNDSDNQLVYGQGYQPRQTKVQELVDRREIQKQKIRAHQAEIKFLEEKEVMLFHSLQKIIQDRDEISVLLEDASQVARAALQKEKRQNTVEMLRRQTQIKELKEQLAFHNAEVDRLSKSHSQ